MKMLFYRYGSICEKDIMRTFEEFGIEIIVYDKEVIDKNYPIERAVTEVAELESATKWQIFWHLKLRYLSSSILFVTILSLINSFKVFREVYLLTGDYPYESLYMLQHYMNNMFRSLDYQKLSAAAILMSLVMIVLIGILFFAENVLGKDLDG